MTSTPILLNTIHNISRFFHREGAVISTFAWGRLLSRFTCAPTSSHIFLKISKSFNIKTSMLYVSHNTGNYPNPDFPRLKGPQNCRADSATVALILFVSPEQEASKKMNTEGETHKEAHIFFTLKGLRCHSSSEPSPKQVRCPKPDGCAGFRDPQIHLVAIFRSAAVCTPAQG